jgi:hypothetical protein
MITPITRLIITALDKRLRSHLSIKWIRRKRERNATADILPLHCLLGVGDEMNCSPTYEQEHGNQL